MLKIFVHSMFVADSETGQTEFVCDNSESRTLGAILEEVSGGNKRVIAAMIDETGHFRPHVAVFFGSEQQRNLGKADIAVDQSVDEISIFPALSGG